LSGQKRLAIAAPVPTQPRKKRRLSWWEADWAAVRRASSVQKVKQEVITEDLPGTAKARPPVEAQNFSDVIGVVRQRTVQGYQLRAEQTEREGELLIRRYTTVSNADFPTCG